jgi:Ca2+-binding EF-hand superfamily protein
MTQSRAGDDDSAEFAKLDKNKDGFIDKAEATMEPKLLAKWAEADTNKDGKISREEFLAFERKEQAAKK